MRQHAEVALLAPVQLTHLESALESVSTFRPHPAAFGSRDWQLFEDLDAETANAGAPAHVFVYASQTGVLHGTVSWHGFYLKHTRSSNGRYTRSKHNRPSTTWDDDQDYWAVYWEVVGRKEIEPIPLSQFRTWKLDSALDTSFVPHGPMLVANPWDD